MIRAIHDYDDLEADSELPLGPDDWLDCDYLVSPDGSLHLLLIMPDAIVCRDADVLEPEDLSALRTWESWFDNPEHGPWHIDEILSDCPAGSWLVYLCRYAKENNTHVIAYRGGRGYTYGLWAANI